jgi:DNA-directed RNA polymerase specialized sigma24 family protein
MLRKAWRARPARHPDRLVRRKHREIPATATREPNHMTQSNEAAARERAAESVLAALSAGAQPDDDALRATLSGLTRFVRRAFPGVDADDVVQMVMIRLWALGGGLERRQIDSPWGYLVGACRYAALDVLKARKRLADVHNQLSTSQPDALDADAIAALLDRDATHDQVSRAFRAAIAAGDDATVPVITVWLDLADELGRAPSLREVEPVAGVSHVTVGAALKRFRAYLDAAAGQ